MPYLKAPSGINWYYQTKGKGKILLFIHGWSFDSKVWFRQFDSFGEYRVVTLDLPGHGNSEYKKEIDIVKDLYSILSSLEIDKVDLIGHSLGGIIALKFAHAYPQLVRKIILVDTAAKFVKSNQYKYGLEVDDINSLGKFLNDDYPQILLVFMRWLFTKEERSKKNFREIWEVITKRDIWPNKESLGEFLFIIQKEDLRKSLNKINIQTLIISGTKDPICPAAAADYLNRQIKNSKIELFQDCGHLPFLTQPQKFNRLVKEFLG